MDARVSTLRGLRRKSSSRLNSIGVSSNRSSGATNRAGFGIEHEIAEPEGVRATPGTGPHEALRAGHHFLPAGARSAPGFSSPATTADPLLPPIIRLTRRA